MHFFFIFGSSEVMDRYKFDCRDIYNVDEMVIITVQRHNRIIAKKRCKMRTITTIAIAVNSAGKIIPQIFVFPRRKYQEYFISNGLLGCIGSANHSSLMNSNNFFNFLRHFIRHTQCNVQRPVLLLLHNHESYFSATGNDFANSHEVLIL